GRLHPTAQVAVAGNRDTNGTTHDDQQGSMDAGPRGHRHLPAARHRTKAPIVAHARLRAEPAPCTGPATFVGARLAGDLAARNDLGASHLAAVAGKTGSYNSAATIRTPSMAIAGLHAARAGWSQREGLPCRRQCNLNGQPFLAYPRYVPLDTAWGGPARQLPWLRCHPSIAAQHPGCRPRCGRRWPTSRHVPSLATQEPARRFRSISAWASSMTCWCGIAGRVSVRAS